MDDKIKHYDDIQAQMHSFHNKVCRRLSEQDKRLVEIRDLLASIAPIENKPKPYFHDRIVHEGDGTAPF